jgi:CheY-like chemotaxis protein
VWVSLQGSKDGIPGFLQPSSNDAPESHAAAQKTKTILIVDDNDGERTVIRSAVENLTKFRVCGEAANGTEGIRRAKELKPDLIIMDLAMPMMNGLEAASILKRELPGVPIVLFTLYADLIQGPRSPMFGITVVVSKENGLAPLLACLRGLLQPS